MSKIICNNVTEKTASLPIYFRTACDRYPEGNISRPFGMESAQILIVADGSGELECQGKKYPLRRGCAFFTDRYVPMKYVNLEGLVTGFITAEGSAIKSIITYLGCGEFVFRDSVNCDRYISDIRQLIDSYHEYRREGALSAMTYSFFMKFLEESVQSVPMTKQDKTALYIEKNFTKKLTLHTLAQEMGISVSAVCHGFKEKFNCTVFEYILNLRLEYARNLLLSSPEVMIKDAAVTSGFENISYFCRSYKKKYGITPGDEQKRQFS